MFGDIITDLGGMLQGGMGVAAGGNINPEPGGTSMFEPMGGSAPKYTGQGKINPIAAINAMAMLLEQAGHHVLIDHRSYAEQGIRLEPTSHVGTTPEKVEKEGRELIREKLAEHDEICRRNGEAIRKDPTIALDAITYQRATFTERDVVRWLNTRTIDADQFRDCRAAVMSSKELVEREPDSRGRPRYTTREMIKTEKNLVNDAGKMDERQGHRVAEKYIDQAARSRSMGDDQKIAFEHIVRDTGDVAVVQGFAGSGKSYMLGAAREAWESQGFSVRGGALAGKAAEGLEISSGIESRSLHSLEYAWRRGRDHLGPRDVLVVDEAGMVGSRQMQRVMSHAEQAGAKVVLVGDIEQLQPIESGAPLRAVADRVGQVAMSDIRRQHEEWQKEATVKLATGRTKEGFEAYDARGHVHEHEDKQAAIRSMVRAWDEHKQEKPDQTQIMLAYRRDDVRHLNEAAREIRKNAGELGEVYLIETERGDREFATGDRVYFLRNDRHLEVKNGTLGTFERIDGESMTVRLDGEEGRRVSFDPREYDHLDHGYAATVHKSQGVTVDRTHALAGDLYDRHVSYVAMSRHRDRVDLHWSRDEFKNKEDLVETMSRARQKDMAMDWRQAVEEGRDLADRLGKEREVEHGRSRSDEKLHGVGRESIGPDQGRDQETEGPGRAVVVGEVDLVVGAEGQAAPGLDRASAEAGRGREPADGVGQVEGVTGDDRPVGRDRQTDRGAEKGDAQEAPELDRSAGGGTDVVPGGRVRGDDVAEVASEERSIAPVGSVGRDETDFGRIADRAVREDGRGGAGDRERLVEWRYRAAVRDEERRPEKILDQGQAEAGGVGDKASTLPDGFEIDKIIERAEKEDREQDRDLARSPQRASSLPDGLEMDKIIERAEREAREHREQGRDLAEGPQRASSLPDGLEMDKIIERAEREAREHREQDRDQAMSQQRASSLPDGFEMNKIIDQAEERAAGKDKAQEKDLDKYPGKEFVLER